ncbi:serine/threonine-protein kinase VRK1 [Rhincodon typus]|uniref:serine/threonine-protein kinase VRK1 n=1 Tax=Rhincodon typus TaxID=259920 RepID=UPI0009A27459|nr:serine/threonine-protein kinase VRK1 [Rhincodon typus]XP_020366607.1 serine/threonine-protein kinase VRK1 [Rhincodon typus]XP_048456132.1 serine/threonine-protein kinase VRK1 [Rhincodon typus]
MPPKRVPAVRTRAPPKRKMAEELKPGEVLTDTAKKQWKIGKPIGKGGFGLLYLADENSDKAVGNCASYVIKVEPSTNGPLFSELKFYMRAAKPELIHSWIASRKLNYLGVPKYWGSGLYDKGGNSYRFMVMDRFGSDLQKIFEQNHRMFPKKFVLQLGLRLIDILEYIHDHEYVHGDIKASNLLLSYKNPNEVYLVDYGLAYRYCPEGVHKEYKEDPKRCHDGTLEFTSIDAHKGAAASRRGDLEILGYCMLQWLSGRLPWEDNLKDANYVRDEKLKYKGDIPGLIQKCFPCKNKPAELTKYFEDVLSLGYKDRPQYQRLRDILKEGLKSIGCIDDGVLVSGASSNGDAPTTSKQQKRRASKQNVDHEGNTSDSELKGGKRTRKSPRAKKPAARRNLKKVAMVEIGTQTSPSVLTGHGKRKHLSKC